MRKPGILITGASGEIGHGLIKRLADDGPIITIDLRPLPSEFADSVEEEFVGSILDRTLLARVLAEYQVDRVFHLAAVLSARGEITPLTAHQVNVEGTLGLLDFAQAQGEANGRPTMFLYPSSIAAYGLPSLEVKQAVGKVKEQEWNLPTTIYGCNKLYCEHLGRYYARHYKQLAAECLSGKVDFRAIRFPGLISEITVPTGGTSDFAPEMIHGAAKAEAYACFVRPDTRIPFMLMVDAVEAIVKLARARPTDLSQAVYNITAFNPSAEEIRHLVLEGFPAAEITFAPDPKRQAIVDSWPADVDDSRAREDWGLAPRHRVESAFSEFLIPRIRTRYE